MESFAEKVKRLRKEKAVPLRVVSAHLDIDQAIISKIENGKRNATRENVIKLARYYGTNEKEMVVSWLSDKILYDVGKDELALEAIEVAEEKITCNNQSDIIK